MGHAHDHVHDTDTYYLDQLCMVGITGAFAGICLTLYFLKTEMLGVLLQDQFHPLIVAAGFTLLGVTLVRAAVLWRAVGKAGPANALAHPHHHHHDHDHAHHEGCNHERHGHHDGHSLYAHHDHQHCDHVDDGPAADVTPLPFPPATDVPTKSNEHHQHTADDGHDHAWAPWRYVVLLVPLMLFLLGLPAKAMPLREVGRVDVKVDWRKEAAQAAALAALGGMPLSQAAVSATMTLDVESTVYLEFKELEQLAFTAASREPFIDKKFKVKVSGQFVPYPGSNQVFFLSRLRIQCCGADAIQLNVPVFSREAISAFKKEDWIRVTGRIEFQEITTRPGVYQTILVVNRAADVEKTNPDPRPYIN